MLTTAEQAVSHIQSGDHVFIHTGAAAPQHLIDALADRHNELKGVEIFQLHTEGRAPYAQLDMKSSFSINAFFVGANVRSSINEENGSYIPVFLSEIPLLFRRKIIELDVALVQVSPPDANGYCSLGISVDATLAAVQEAKMVIAQINPNMPRTHGEGWIHINDIDYYYEGKEEIPTVHLPQPSEIDQAIGEHIATIVEDGATLQMGIGNIPNAALSCLEGHKDLGVHTEMFSDGLLPLIEKGVITGKHKKKHPGKIVATFAIGTHALYDMMHDNPLLQMLDCEYTNKTSVIAKNPKVTAINSAIEIDLTGQVCADSIGPRIYSGVGGQMDFMRAAALSEGGKPIIAMHSRTSHGRSKIVSQLQRGAGVVTTRAHVHYVVTEYGIASLYGKSIEQRAKALINISHPEDRAELERNFRTVYGR